MCQYRLFGAIDYGDTKNSFYNLLGGEKKSGSFSAADVEKYVKKSSLGAHVRIGGHSLVILSVTKNGFTTYECNSSVRGRECRVYTRSWTFKSFFDEYKNSDWKYLNLPREVEKVTTAPVTSAALTTTTPPTTSAEQIIAPITTSAEVPPTAPSDGRKRIRELTTAAFLTS